MNTLQNIVWSDLCVSQDPDKAWFKETPDSMVAARLPKETWDEVSRLFNKLNAVWADRGAEALRYGFPIVWPPESGMRLRAKRIPLGNGEHVFVCRAFRFKPRQFSEIGMAAPLEKRLMAKEIRSGIGLFLGRPGAGKTTTAYAYIQERARVFGGVTWAIESPIELALEGRYENGYIHQREVETPEDMHEAIRDNARATPNVIFVGEVLDDRTAEVVVQASTMGFLVLCTYHGGDLITGIERFARAAGRGHISAQFAESFRFAVHIDLKLVDTGGNARAINDSVIGALKTGNPPRVLATQSLFCFADNDSMRAHLKSGEFGKLKSEIERQKNELLTSLSEMNLARAR